MNAYVSVLKKYAEFSGRATRSEYWMFALFNAIVVIILEILDSAIGTPSLSSTGTPNLLTAIYTLAVFLPGLGVFVRRMHDAGRSGWWFFIAFTGVGLIVLLVFLVQDSQPANQYGPNPKGIPA